IGQRLERSVAGACYRSAAASVVDQGVNSLLEHTLLVAHDNIRRAQLQQSSQTVISVNNSSVQVIQVRCRETSAVKLYHRTQIRRDYRNYVHDHPLRTVAGFTECLHNLQSLDDPCAL